MKLSILAIRLKELREEKNQKQQEVAANLGLKRPTYTSYEVGNAKPGIDTLIALADYFNVSLDYLVGRGENREFIEIQDPERAKREHDVMCCFRRLNDDQQIKLAALMHTLF